MSDLAEYAPPSLDARIADQRKRWEALRRECFKRALSHSFDYAEAALDHERDLRRAGYSTTAELAEARTTLEANLVAVMAAQKEQGVL